jgi:hypothetical protein
MLGVTAKMDGLQDALDGGLDQMAAAVTAGMGEGTGWLKEELREQVLDAGLGSRLAFTWRSEVYPKGRDSLDPAGFVWSKAPEIITYFSARITVSAGHGRFLAIPTEDVPKSRNGRPISVEECAERFGKRFVYIAPNDKGFHTPSIRRNGVAYMVLKDLVIRKASGKYRNASASELAKRQAGKRHNAISAVIMFILVPQVTSRKLLDLQATADKAGQKVADLIKKDWSD